MRTCRSVVAVCTLVGGLTLAASAMPPTPPLAEGDLYLASASLPGPGGTATRGILRIDPLTQVASLFPYAPTNGFFAQLSYDPFRNALIVVDSDKILALPGDGSSVSMTPGDVQIRQTAPTGDGRIYYFHSNGRVAFVSGTGVRNAVLNLAGDDDYIVPQADHMIWDAGTNALFTADRSAGGTVRVTRAVMNPTGSQVVALDSTQIDVSTTGEVAVGFSRGPGGSIFLAVDTNQNAEEPRMLLIDPPSLEVGTFATSNYFGVAGQVAGVFSPLNNAAVVLDSLGDQLRSYAQGGSGAGTIWGTTGVSSPGGSGELAQLIVIGAANPPCAADLNGDGFLDNGDINVFITLFLAGNLAADLNGDGFLDNGDINAFITAFLAGC